MLWPERGGASSPMLMSINMALGSSLDHGHPNGLTKAADTYTDPWPHQEH